ncbi:hypothetical protein ACHAW5_000077 [Stephanodiscus triporus]|uniref:Uncharacterized protein n=1 Tax=Stephanodiscus triporus TaxID=2934178 RepID=A0ABD3P2D2_9STRA
MVSLNRTSLGIAPAGASGIDGARGTGWPESGVDIEYLKEAEHQHTVRHYDEKDADDGGKLQSQTLVHHHQANSPSDILLPWKYPGLTDL